MPSSISSSEPAGPESVTAAPQRHDRYTRAIVLSLVCLGFLAFLLEAGTRIVFNRMSQIAKRVAVEYTVARAISPGLSAQSPAILMAGNSLLLQGVNIPDLQQSLGNGPRVARFVVENTTWLDWYYGIRRLLAEGSRPNVILLCLNTPQLLSSTIRGPFSSFYLFQARDIPAVAQEADYNLTKASNLLLAHYSRFYADRTNLRSFLLNRLDPAYVEMMFEMTVRPTSLPSGAEIERIAEPRLRALKAMGDAAGVRCILLIPPGSTPGEKEIGAAAARIGAEVWVPIPQNALPRGDYQEDNYHLNPHGAAIFTQALAVKLKDLVAATK